MFFNALNKKGFLVKEKTKFRFDKSAFQDPPFVAALLPTHWPLQHDHNDNQACSIFSAKHWTPKSIDTTPKLGYFFVLLYWTHCVVIIN
jgi:hypothetical protein